MAVAYGSNPETADTSDDVSARAEPIYGSSGNNSILEFGDNDLMFWGEAAQPPPCCLPS
jgi:hypothetical protein